MGKKKAMRLLDPATGLMECKFCGSLHNANNAGGGRWARGSWQRRNGCCLTKLTLSELIAANMAPQVFGEKFEAAAQCEAAQGA